MKENRGFSLFELLIVVGIILIISAIAIPSLLRYRKAANESRAVANLRIISTAQVTYQASGNYGTIAGLQAEGLLDSRFLTANQPTGGYNYTITPTAPTTEYTAIAIPVSANTGRFGYYSGPDNVVRYSSGTGVTAGAPVQ